MKTMRFLLIATAAVVLMTGARPTAEDEQFPRGLMSSAPKGGGGGSCVIQVRPLVFRSFDPAEESAGLTAIGSVIYLCGDNGREPGTRAAQERGIRIEMEQGSSGSFQPRHMVGQNYVSLDYNIYLDSTFQTIWGTGEGRTEVYLDGNPPLNRPVIVPIFARIYGRQDVPAGQYADNVAVRIVF